MNNAYLEEDIRLIRRYFPGAKTTTLRTPFDLTVSDDPWRLRVGDCDEPCEVRWQGGALWSH